MQRDFGRCDISVFWETDDYFRQCTEKSNFALLQATSLNCSNTFVYGCRQIHLNRTILSAVAADVF